MIIPTIIERPLQRLAVRTPEEYRARQAQIIAQNLAALPEQSHGTVHAVSTPIAAHVGVGAWRVICVCGEAPPADPDWQLACCSGCGAVYEHVLFPPDRNQIEDVLLKRRLCDRNWRLPWTADDLRAQNLAHGDPV